jgi:hypothetical protein
MSSFASEAEKQEALRRMARRYAHLKNRPLPDHVADTRMITHHTHTRGNPPTSATRPRPLIQPANPSRP